MVKDTITVTVHSGDLSFSFETDHKGTNIEDAVSSILEILETYAGALRKVGQGMPGQQIPRQRSQAHDSDVIVSLADLSMPSGLQERIAAEIKTLSNWDILLTILYYAPNSGLSNKQVRSISEELGKPI